MLLKMLFGILLVAMPSWYAWYQIHWMVGILTLLAMFLIGTLLTKAVVAGLKGGPHAGEIGVRVFRIQVSLFFVAMVAVVVMDVSDEVYIDHECDISDLSEMVIGGDCRQPVIHDGR